MSEKATVPEIAELGEVADMDSDKADENVQEVGAVSGEIVGVASLSEYESCINCSGAKISGINETLAECSKCGTLMKREICPKRSVARVILNMGSNTEQLQVTLFDEVVSKITTGVVGGNTTEKLLGAPVHRFMIDKKGVAFSATLV